jgi:hypothetical protein
MCEYYYSKLSHPTSRLFFGFYLLDE